MTDAGFTFHMPTDEERRQMSVDWYAVSGPTHIDQWPDALAALSMPTKLVRMPDGLGMKLFEGMPFDTQEAKDFASLLDAELGYERQFIRLSSRSPKDAPWPFELPVTMSGKEALGIMAASERMLDDLARFHWLPEHPAYVCLREFLPGMQAASEFRCFVKGGELIAVTHYDYLHPISPPTDGGQEIRATIDRYFAERVMPALHIDTVVFDLWFDWGGKPLLIEINPYGKSDPCWFGAYANVEAASTFVQFAPPSPATP